MTLKNPASLYNNVAIATSIVFLLTGLSKVLCMQFQYDRFINWSVPVWAMLLIGLIEIICAIGMLFSRSRGLASVILVMIMGVAFGAHLVQSSIYDMVLTFVMVSMVYLSNFQE